MLNTRDTLLRTLAADIAQRAEDRPVMLRLPGHNRLFPLDIATVDHTGDAQGVDALVLGLAIDVTPEPQYRGFVIKSPEKAVEPFTMIAGKNKGGGKIGSATFRISTDGKVTLVPEESPYTLPKEARQFAGKTLTNVPDSYIRFLRSTRPRWVNMEEVQKAWAALPR